ncbi:LxmA leader domain family RiPP [Microbispora sp. NEAU-D428]|uniref:LxmA leader domain family RiPP n=1 Tax=Microbispora TaxID=2005 RepID=UPI001866F5D7|nr:LxmA leader domain family RiPP [Microbispora sitophila]MBE3008552.1 LxmA leader domain family RiPP [Microbispora sitophila]
MKETMSIEELVAGYRSYADVADLNVAAAVDAPATTPFCGFLASFAFSYITTNGPG